MNRSQYETLSFDASIAFGIFADTGGVVNGSFFSGTDILMQNTQVDNLPVATSIKNEDLTITDLVGAGEKLGIFLVEAAGAAGPTIVRTQGMIIPI